MKATAKKTFGSDSLEGKRIAVQGIGQVGYHLVELLVKENARVFIADLAEDKVKSVSRDLNVTGVELNDIYDLEMDIFAPCALGATLNDETIPRLKCAMIAGAANNQLKDEVRNGYMLLDRNITYAPDFLINAGGLINVYIEYQGNYNRKRVMEQTDKIYTTCLQVLNKAEEEKINSQEAAIQLAERRIKEIARLRSTF
jgi:leucine dehydrogenase